MNKLDFVKIKNFCSLKNIKKTKSMKVISGTHMIKDWFSKYIRCFSH